MRTDLDWTMAAVGMRNGLVSLTGIGFAAGPGPSVFLVSDAMWVRMTSDASGNLNAAASEVSRLRIGPEGEWRIGLVPHLAFAARRDGGDARDQQRL